MKGKGCSVNRSYRGSKQTVSLKGTGLAAIAVALSPASATVALKYSP
jgi:hypothetical protein